MLPQISDETPGEIQPAGSVQPDRQNVEACLQTWFQQVEGKNPFRNDCRSIPNIDDVGAVGPGAGDVVVRGDGAPGHGEFVEGLDSGR